MEVQSFREQILLTDNEFLDVLANTSGLGHAARRLRYQVYCVERGAEPRSNDIETDQFDAYARQVLLIPRQRGRPSGPSWPLLRGARLASDMWWEGGHA